MYYRYYHYPGDHQVQPHYGVRTDRHKLIYFNRLDEWELYDLEKDPRELKNVYTERAYAGTVRKLKAELARLRKEFDDHDQFADELSNGAVFQEVPLELVLRPGFSDIRDGVVKDTSGKGNDGKLSGAEIVMGRRGKALKFDGQGSVVVGTKLDPSGKPFTVGAWCRPESADGVIIAQGGGSHGFALYVKDGLPQFAVRSRGTLSVVRGRAILAPGQWSHLTGLLNARGEIHLRVNGQHVGMAKSGAIAAKPADGLSLGDDTGSKVGAYGAGTAWRGSLEDVRLYWGELNAEAIASWASN